MFAAMNIPPGALICEEEPLIRALCFDIFTSQHDDGFLYQEVIGTLMHQYSRMQSPIDHLFVQRLEPHDGEEPFILRVMRKYGLETQHLDYFHCTALYRNICRVNHSCHDANAFLSSRHGPENDWEVGSLKASRYIFAGEEILLDYTVLGGKRVHKRDVFQKYKFHCSCTTCNPCPPYEYLQQQDWDVERDPWVEKL
jgi:SET domain